MGNLPARLPLVQGWPDLLGEPRAAQLQYMIADVLCQPEHAVLPDLRGLPFAPLLFRFASSERLLDRVALVVPVAARAQQQDQQAGQRQHGDEEERTH